MRLYSVARLEPVKAPPEPLHVRLDECLRAAAAHPPPLGALSKKESVKKGDGDGGGGDGSKGDNDGSKGDNDGGKKKRGGAAAAGPPPINDLASSVGAYRRSQAKLLQLLEALASEEAVPALVEASEEYLWFKDAAERLDEVRAAAAQVQQV